MLVSMFCDKLNMDKVKSQISFEAADGSFPLGFEPWGTLQHLHETRNENETCQSIRHRHHHLLHPYIVSLHFNVAVKNVNFAFPCSKDIYLMQRQESPTLMRTRKKTSFRDNRL
jgi:hypothetical protein